MHLVLKHGPIGKLQNKWKRVDDIVCLQSNVQDCDEFIEPEKMSPHLSLGLLLESKTYTFAHL